MLWDATVKNIRSGQDVFSPLVQPLPRTYAQDDPELINIIRQKYLVPPSEDAYNIKAKEDTSMGQAQTVRQILNNKVELHILHNTHIENRTKFPTFPSSAIIDPSIKTNQALTIVSYIRLHKEYAYTYMCTTTHKKARSISV